MKNYREHRYFTSSSGLVDSYYKIKGTTYSLNILSKKKEPILICDVFSNINEVVTDYKNKEVPMYYLTSILIKITEEEWNKKYEELHKT